MKTLKPLRDHVVIKLVREDRTASGIILAPDAQETKKTAEVIAVGPDVTDVKDGDEVLFDIFAGIVISEESNQIITLVTEGDIKAIFVEEK